MRGQKGQGRDVMGQGEKQERGPRSWRMGKERGVRRKGDKGIAGTKKETGTQNSISQMPKDLSLKLQVSKGGRF